jgi:hypothetical protein
VSPAGVAQAAARVARSARPVPGRPRLTVVPPLRANPPRAPFVLLVGALLTTGLGALLLLHTALAEDSFRLHDLKARSVALADREQQLEQEVAAAASPQRLAARAKALGMVRSENPVFIRTADGRILGVPKAGSRPAPKPTATATAAPTGQPAAGAAAQKKQTGAKASAKPRAAATRAATQPAGR